MRKRLTARSVKSAKAINGRRTDVFDAVVPGLALRVSPSGSKSWAVLYRSRGRLRRLTIVTRKRSNSPTRARKRGKLSAQPRRAATLLPKRNDAAARKRSTT